MTGPPPSELLALLDRDAPESELRDHLRTLDAALADPAEAERLAHHAVALHAARASERRHAQALTLVGETAADLAGRRDTDDLLAAVCRRSRQLLGTDIAYVTVRDDERGDTFVRASDGLVSPELREMRLPMGVGLGGLVAASGEPASTADYAADPRLRHESDVDRRVAAEGLRSLVGVPLTRGRDVFGVLLSGSRAPRSFAADEVARFATLGTHAAIALENARLLAEAGAAVATLRRLHADSERRADAVRRGAEASDALAAEALRGAQVPELLASFVARVPGAVQWRDAGGTVLARHPPDAPTEGGDWIRAPLHAGSESLGELRLRPDDPQGFEAEALQHVSVVVVGVLLARRAESDASSRRLGMLLEELLVATDLDAGELAARAGRAGLDLERGHSVLVLAPSWAAERWAWLNATRRARERDAVVGTTRGRIVVVDPDPDLASAAMAWGTAVTPDGDRPTIGAARSAPGVAGLRAAHRAAQRVVGILVALDRLGTWADGERLGILGQVLGLGGEDDLAAYVDRTLAPMVDYDEAHGSQLLQTLDAYLAEGGHLANTRRRLRIHVNTLYQRLARLESVLGKDWSSADRRLELQLALRLRALRGELLIGDDGEGRPRPGWIDG